MATETDIRAVLFGRLAALALAPVHPIAWPNVAFTPPNSNRWLRATHLPFTQRGLSVESTGSNEYRGALQVDVYAPLQAGVEGPEAIAAQIANHFKRNTVLTAGTTRLNVTSTLVSQGMSEGNRWQIPVTINYRAHAPN